MAAKSKVPAKTVKKTEKTPAPEETKKKHAGGRPPKYSTVEELKVLVEAYFQWCDKNIYPYTITGLAMALGMDRRGLLNYEGKPEFTHAIKAAKQKCRWYVEKELFMGKNQAAMIFWLKNNDDWKDKNEHEVTGPNGTSLFDPASLVKVAKIIAEGGDGN